MTSQSCFFQWYCSVGYRAGRRFKIVRSHSVSTLFIRYHYNMHRRHFRGSKLNFVLKPLNLELNFSEFWTSGRYSQEGNNRWEWASVQPFQPFNYTNWHPVYNQPDDNEPGSCALLYFLDYSGYWADNVCIYSTRLICESIEWTPRNWISEFIKDLVKLCVT